jgi:hypothetical protein
LPVVCVEPDAVEPVNAGFGVVVVGDG